MDERASATIEAINALVALNQIDVARIRVDDLVSQLPLASFVSYSDSYNFPKFTDVLRRALPWIEHDNVAFRQLIRPVVARWLALAAAYAPVEFLQTLKVLANDVPHFLYFTLPSFLDALSSVSEQEQPKYTVLLIKIIEASPTKDLAECVPGDVWDMFQRNTSEMNVLRLIKRFVEENCGERAVSVLARKSPLKFTEFVFQKAELKFLARFMALLPPDFEFDVLTISARVADEFHVDVVSFDDLYEMVPIIAKNPTTVEKAAMRPIWKSVEEMLAEKPTGPKLRALYAAVSVGAFEREDIVKYLNFDNKDPRYQHESFKIALDLVDLDSFTATLFHILPQVSGTRNNLVYNSLIDKLETVFPMLYEKNQERSLLIVGSAMNPVPVEEKSRVLVLKFLNSVPMDVLTEKYGVFNVKRVIETCMNSNKDSLLPGLKALVKKMEYKIGPLEFDWVGDALRFSLEICQNPVPQLLIDMLAFHIVPYDSIPTVIGHLERAKAVDFYDVAHDTLFWILCETGSDVAQVVAKTNAQLVVDKSIIGKYDSDRLIEEASSPYVECSLGKIILALLGYLTELYDVTNHSNDHNISLLAMARFIARLFPEKSVDLIRHVLKSQNTPVEKQIVNDMLRDYIPEAHSVCFAQLAVDELGGQAALEHCRDLCLTACGTSRDVASAIAEWVDQPLKPMSTFFSFAEVEKHKEWVEKCKEEIPKEQWILVKGEEGFVEEDVAPVDDRRAEVEERHFEMSKVEPAEGIKGVFDGTRFSIVSYFTHYNATATKPAEIPGVTIEELEQYVMDNACADIRLVIGFCFYSYRRKYETQKAEEWTQKLVSSRTEAELYAVSLFLNSVTFSLSDPPEFLRKFIMSHLENLGYLALTKPILNYAFHKEHGMKWYFIRSIMSVDPPFMSEYPLVVAEFAEGQQLTGLYEKYFTELNPATASDQLMACFVSIISVLFKPQKVIQQRYWPIAHRVLYSLPITPTLPPPVRLDPKLVDALLSALEKQKCFPSQFFSLLFHICIDRPFHDRVDQLLKPKTADAQHFFRFLLPSMYFAPAIEQGYEAQLDETALDFYENRTPSFSLSFYRSLMVIFAPPLPQTLISEIENILCPVFPEFGLIGLKTWENCTEATRILSGALCEKPLDELKTAGRETVSVYNALMSNRGFTERAEATKAILDLAVAEGTPLTFGVAIADAIARYDSSISEMVSAPGFIDGCHNVLNAIVLVQRLSKKLNKPELIETAKNNTTNEDKKAIFACLESRESLAKVLQNP